MEKNLGTAVRVRRAVALARADQADLLAWPASGAPALAAARMLPVPAGLAGGACPSVPSFEGFAVTAALTAVATQAFTPPLAGSPASISPV